MVAPADRLSRERPVRRTQATPRAPPGVQASGECRLRGAHGRCDYPPEAIAIRRSGLSLGGVLGEQTGSYPGADTAMVARTATRAVQLPNHTVSPRFLHERVDHQLLQAPGST